MVNQKLTYEATFANLRDILASIYPDEASARRVAADAGLDGRHIAFDGHAANNWHAILTEAENANRTRPLLDIVLAEYQDNPDLRSITEQYGIFFTPRYRGGSVRHLRKPLLKRLNWDVISVMLIGAGFSIAGYVLYLQTLGVSSLLLWASIFTPLVVGIWLGRGVSLENTIGNYFLVGLGSGLLTSLGISLCVSLYYYVTGTSNGRVDPEAVFYLYFLTPFVLVVLGGIVGDWLKGPNAEDEGVPHYAHRLAESIMAFVPTATEHPEKQTKIVARVIFALAPIIALIASGLTVWLAYLAVVTQ